VLRAGRTPGTVDVELKVADALPLHGSVDVNDMYTADTSRLRMSAGMSFDNLFRRRHSLSLQFQVAPEDPDETRALIASYSFRVPALRGTSFALYAVDSHSDIAAVGTLSVRGNGQIFGARMNRTLQATPRYYSALTLGLDYKDFLEDIRLEDSPGLVTPISYLNWSLEYTGTLRGSDGGCSTTFSTGANFGLRGLFNETREFADKRFLGRPNYFTVTAGMQQLCPLFRHTQLFARVAGQYTPDALVSNEQVSIGGAATVRGYAESAALGDYGGSASLELRNDWIVKPLGLAAGQAYFLGFVEYGAVAIHDPLPSQDRATGLGSFGVGLRVNAWHGLDAAFDWAWAASSWTTVERGDGRAHFRLRYSF
jgi:hemolysin activation/secretion protein